MYDGVPTVSKVTGMLLERPTEAVGRLLGNSDKLLAEVGQSLDCLQINKQDEWVFKGLRELCINILT